MENHKLVDNLHWSCIFKERHYSSWNGQNEKYLILFEPRMSRKVEAIEDDKSFRPWSLLVYCKSALTNKTFLTTNTVFGMNVFNLCGWPANVFHCLRTLTILFHSFYVWYWIKYVLFLIFRTRMWTNFIIFSEKSKHCKHLHNIVHSQKLMFQGM